MRTSRRHPRTASARKTPRRVLAIGTGGPAWSRILRALGRAGYRVEKAEPNMDPESIAVRARARRAVIVVDLSSDPLRGHSTLLACRGLARDNPLIVVTRDAAIDIAARIRAGGVFYHALHPITAPELCTVLRDAFRCLRARRSAVSSYRESRRVLIVGHDPDFRCATTALLERAGYSVSPALGGEDELRRALSVRPDLIVLDVREEDEASARAQADAVLRCTGKSARRIPVLTVSASARPPGSRSGPDGASTLEELACLPKPLDVPVFLARIAQLLDAARREEDARV